VNQLDFEGRTAIVTGGAQGIGLAIVKRLLDSGATVRIWDRDKALLDRTVGALSGSASGASVDVTDAGAIAKATDDALRALGRIDVLVNNAGIAGMAVPTIEYTVEEWEKVLKVNLTGPFLTCRAIAPHMVKGKYGRIVNIASIAGKEGNPNASAYSAAKAGVIALTKALGKELAGDDIAVTCITPGVAKTRILDQVTQAHIDYMLAKVPRGRFLQVEELASLVGWLVSRENSFATGAVFDLSGGRATY
jgi:3-oxoacyl-[acyl-carrier protein] reductase